MIIQLSLLLPRQCYGGCRFGLFDKAMQYCSLQKVLHFLHFHTSIVPWLELKERAAQYIVSKEEENVNEIPPGTMPRTVDIIVRNEMGECEGGRPGGPDGEPGGGPGRERARESRGGSACQRRR